MSRVPLWAEMWENWPCVRDHALGSSTSVSDRAAGEGLVSVCLVSSGCPSQKGLGRRRSPSRAGDSGDLLCRHRASPRTAGSERSKVGRPPVFSHRLGPEQKERMASKDGRAHLLGLKRLWTRRRRDVSAPPRPTHRGFETGGSSPSPYSNLTAALPRHVTASLLRQPDSRMGEFGVRDATEGRFAVRRGHGDGDRRGERQPERKRVGRIKSSWRSAVIRKARLRGRSDRRRF